MSSAPAPRASKKKKKVDTTRAVDPLLQDNANTYSRGSTESLLPLPAPAAPRPNRPKLHLWSTSRPTSFDAILIETSSPLQLPLQCVQMQASTESDPDLDEEDPMAVDEATRLKGVFWPGMDIFDSATVDMKRKRNQKKDDSVLEHLEQNSLIVEPNEVIYYPLGAFKKQRTITGKIDTSSDSLLELQTRSNPQQLPLADPQPLPAKKKPTGRRPLAERSVNTAATPMDNTLNSNIPSSHAPKRPAKERKRKRGFPVHKDEKDHEPAFGNPTGMKLLTAEFGPANQNHALVPDQGTTHSGIASQYASAYDGSLFQSGFAPYQSLRGSPQRSFFGPTGYDLASFLAHALRDDCYTQYMPSYAFAGEQRPVANNDDEQYLSTLFREDANGAHDAGAMDLEGAGHLFGDDGMTVSDASQ